MYQIRYLWVHPICYFVNVEFSVSYNAEGLTIVKLRIIKIQLILHTSVSEDEGNRSSRIVVVAANYDIFCNNNTHLLSDGAGDTTGEGAGYSLLASVAGSAANQLVILLTSILSRRPLVRELPRMVNWLLEMLFSM